MYDISLKFPSGGTKEMTCAMSLISKFATVISAALTLRCWIAHVLEWLNKSFSGMVQWSQLWFSGRVMLSRAVLHLLPFPSPIPHTWMERTIEQSLWIREE